MAPALIFCSEHFASNSYAESHIYSLVSHIPTLNPGTERADKPDAGKKISSAHLGGYLHELDMEERSLHMITAELYAVWIGRRFQLIVRCGQLILRSNLKLYMQSTVKKKKKQQNTLKPTQNSHFHPGISGRSLKIELDFSM